MFLFILYTRDRRGRDRIVVGFTTTYAISDYHHDSYEFESRSCPRVHNTTLCDNVCQWLAEDRWFSLHTPVSSTNKTDRHDMTEILLKMALNTITLNLLYKNVSSLILYFADLLGEIYYVWRYWTFMSVFLPIKGSRKCRYLHLVCVWNT